MNQSERRRFLIEELLAEEPEYQNAAIPADADGQRRLLRALLNVRPPRAVPERFLRVQDAYLQEESARRDIVDGNALPPVCTEQGAALCIWQGDITTLKVDAIVNAANSGMTGCYVPNHTCIDNIVHSRSGIQLRLYCADMMCKQGHEEATGKAKITPAFNLPSKYILHTVGPIITGRVTDNDCKLLASCYRSCLELASAYKLESIAFCCISTGVFRFPNDRAAEVAVQTVREFLQTQTSIKRVIFNVFKDLDKELYEQQLCHD